MRNLWDDRAAAEAGPGLPLRAYSSRLIGSDPDLVLHGGGNTSWKDTQTDRFGEKQRVIWVKASGFDLGRMGPEGFTALTLDSLLQLAELPALSDADMVAEVKRARLNPDAAAASIEAIVHALFPATFVDHSHADAVLTLSNAGGRALLERVYGDRVLILPYVKPGFDLARQIRTALPGIGGVQGIILEHHGIFSWGETARESYDRMIALCALAEDWLASELPPLPTPPASDPAPRAVAMLRSAVTRHRRQEPLDDGLGALGQRDGAVAGISPLGATGGKRHQLVADIGRLDHALGVNAISRTQHGPDAIGGMRQIVGEAKGRVFGIGALADARIEDVILALEIDGDVRNASRKGVRVISQPQIKRGATRQPVCCGPFVRYIGHQAGKGSLVVRAEAFLDRDLTGPAALHDAARRDGHLPLEPDRTDRLHTMCGQNDHQMQILILVARGMQEDDHTALACPTVDHVARHNRLAHRHGAGLQRDLRLRHQGLAGVAEEQRAPKPHKGRTNSACSQHAGDRPGDGRDSGDDEGHG